MNNQPKILLLIYVMLLLVNHALKKKNLDIYKCQLINSISLTQTSWFTSFNGSYEESHGHFIFKTTINFSQ